MWRSKRAYPLNEIEQAVRPEQSEEPMSNEMRSCYGVRIRLGIYFLPKTEREAL